MKKSISKKIFLMYSIIFSIVFIGYNVVMIRYMANDINDRVITTQKQMRYNIVSNIENYFKDMNNFSRTLLNSESFKRNVIATMPELYEKKQNYASNFTEIYQVAHQMVPNTYKIGVHVFSGYYLWIGNDFIFGKLGKQEVDTYKEYQGYGRIVIKRIKKNAYIERITNHEEKYESDDVISLARTMNVKNYFQYPQAMLEIQVSGQELDEIIEDICQSNNMEIAIFNREGEVLHNTSDFNIQEFMEHGEVIEQEKQQRDALVKVEGILESNMYVATVIPNTFYNLNVVQFMKYSIFGALLLMLLMYIITYFVSREFSKPIKKICRVVERMELKKDSLNGIAVETNIAEIDLLWETVCKLHDNLLQSMDEIVSLKEYELQSVFVAMQAQIQPHFLYNTLMNISAIADEIQSDKIVNMCDALTSMLRFIASKENDDNTIYDEVNYLKNYIKIMKVRFPDTEIDYDIPLELTLIKVPKLIIQPIVENSFKYAESYPLKLSIVGYQRDGRWFVEIQDNGKGFSEEKIEQFTYDFKHVVYEKNMLDRTINGIGIVNIYTRLYINYKEAAVFEVENRNGALVRIGGSVGESEN